MSLLLDRLSKGFMKDIGTKSREVYEMMLPAVDMYEDGSELVIAIDLPGFAKEKIKTRLSEHHLVISARREPDEIDGMIYWEQRPLHLRKRIPLPVKIETDEDDETLVAKYESGVLTVRLPIKGVGKVKVE
jgi:HSP20 family protein